ncbi:MAG: hypothetical protein ABS76_07175 [Pelagibacterium sp. SCN 64-44]|nr:MAG: hypothetical protein ABS76_07175 [Pelagibacterium sp. SCN 64-44]
MQHSSLGTILEDRNNGFNGVRLLAATAVFVSHAFLIAPAGWHGEPLDGSAYNLGQISVNVFFFLSGMMLSRSFALKPDLISFIAARLLRIFPGLIACGAATAWIIGAMNTSESLAAYFTDPATLTYPLRVLVQFNVAELQGVFQHGQEPGEINVPLWTVKFELFAYAAFLAIPILGLFGSRLCAVLLTLGFGAMLAVSSVTHAFDTSFWGSIIRFGFCFTLGMSAFLYRDSIRPNWPLALFGIILAMALPPWPLGQVFSALAFAYFAVTLGGSSLPWLTRATNRSDISYGLYLYSFPIQQALIARHGVTPASALGVSFLAFAIAVLAAYCSWVLIEKPALSLKHWFRVSAPARG